MRIKRLVVHQDALNDASMLNPTAFTAMVQTIVQATAAGCEIGVVIADGVPQRVLRTVTETVNWLWQIKG